MQEQLLDIVCCPSTHQALSRLDRAALRELNERIGAGEVRRIDESVVTNPLRAGLITRDGSRIYPIIDGLVDLLPDSAIVVGDKA
ncbi:MAG: Trm112 family protein [Pseudomonadota bacterium]